jgi:hypothetical protein
MSEQPRDALEALYRRGDEEGCLELSEIAATAEELGLEDTETI